MIKKALEQYAASQNRAWASDRSQTVGASEVGQCARKVYWLKNENDPSHAAPRDPDYVDTWGARFRGTVMENEFWFPAMKLQFGERLKFAGPDQQTFTSGFLSATPDGLIDGLRPGELKELPDGGCVTGECKSADPRSNLTEAKAENIYQTHIQMGLVRKLTPYQPTHSLLSYIDASFWNEVREFVIPFDPKVFAAGEARATMIMTATDAADLKPEGWIAGGHECDHCPFTKACGIERRRVPVTPEAADPQFVAEITDLARAIKQLDEASDANATRARELTDELKTRLRAKNVRAIPGVVSWSSVKGRSGFDNKAIKQAAIEAGVDVEQFATQGEPTDRLVITLSEVVYANAAA